MKVLFPIFIWLSALGWLQAQEYGGYHFGLKGGLTVGQQTWNNFNNDPLFSYHGAAFIESLAEEGRFSLFGQLGYHVKGSAIRFQFVDRNNGQVFRPPANTFEFYNLSLIAGGKQIFTNLGQGGVYYLVGIRLDYTLDTNLDDYEGFIEQNPQFASIYPINSDQFIREINYGVSVGGGIQFPLSELIGASLELTVNPDFSIQYQSPAIPNVADPFTGQLTTIQEREIRNLTVELTFGLRFLRKVEYID